MGIVDWTPKPESDKFDQPKTPWLLIWIFSVLSGMVGGLFAYVYIYFI